MVSLRFLPWRQKTVYHARFSGIAENKRSKLNDERGAEIERDTILNFLWNENKWKKKKRKRTKGKIVDWYKINIILR